MKKLVSLLLALVMVLGVVPLGVMADGLERSAPEAESSNDSIIMNQPGTTNISDAAFDEQVKGANDQTIWNFLYNKLGNAYGTAGVMGNLYAESGLRPNNLQGSYESSLGYSDEAYTAAVDNGTYTNFVHDSAGYGLAQWTYWSRKQDLLNYARNAGTSIGNLNMQLGFLWKELTESYSSLLNTLRNATSVEVASTAVLTQFEKPANQGSAVQALRASYSQGYYDTFANSGHTVVMTAEQFINCLQIALNRGDSVYKNVYPYNLGYYDGTNISWDCWNLGKSIIWSGGSIVNNYTVGHYQSVNTSCGLGDWTGAQIMEVCSNCNDNFTSLIPGEWLYMEGHTGYYIGNGQVIECTKGWGVDCVTQSQIGSDGRRSRNGVNNGYWLLHGMVPWIDYTSVMQTDSVPTGTADLIAGGTNSIHIRGWAFDSDCPIASLQLHVYIGGELCGIIVADTYRPDVNAAHGVGDYHGYDEILFTTKYGSQLVEIYAINVDSNGNAIGTQNKLIGSQTVTIEKQASVTYFNCDGETFYQDTAPEDGCYTLIADYPYSSSGYFSGWSYSTNSTSFDVRPGDTISAEQDIELYPVYISHSEAVSGAVVPIYNIADFDSTGYTIQTTQYVIEHEIDTSYWTDWSDWSADYMQASDTVQVETRTAYYWYYYLCPNCGAHMHVHGTCYTWADGCGYAGSDFNYGCIHEFYSSVSYDNASDFQGTTRMYCDYTEEGRAFIFYPDSQYYVDPITQYRYKTYIEQSTISTTIVPGYIITPYHEIVYISAEDPTCMENGCIGYYYCEDCGKCFADEEGANEIAYEDTIIPALGHEFHEEDDVFHTATCTSYAYTQHNCCRCDYSYNEYVGVWSEWSTEYPEGISEKYIESCTEYRYRDYVTTTSYETSMTGWDRIGSEWVQSGTGTIDYVETWAGGFSDTPFIDSDERPDRNPHVHPVYLTYNNMPMTAGITETEKTVVNSTVTAGYIYWHWCRGWYTEGPDNRSFTPFYIDTGDKYTSFVAFHAFFSTTAPESLERGGTDGDYDSVFGQQDFYKFPNSNCCLDTYWYYALPVLCQTYTTYRNLFTYGQWGDWSNWSTDPVDATDTREVETRTVYRYVIGEYGQHEWDEGVVTIEPTIYTEGEMTYTCVHCHETHTEPIPVLESCTVTFKDWDGTVLKTQQVEYGGAATAPADPSRAGYVFTGWDVDFSCVTSDLIVTAQYEQNVQSTDPPIPSDAPKIVVESKTAVAGNTVAVAVKLENNPGIVSMKLRLSYDGRLTLTSVEDTGLLPGKMHAPSLTNPYLLVWENDTASSNYTVNGTIAILTFEIPEGTEAGDYAVNISYDADNYDIFNFDLDAVDFAVLNGKITVLDVLIGDVNSDGRVNSMDRALLGRYLAGWASVPASMINMTAADVNLDGRVNTMDRAILGRHLAGWAGYEELPYTAKSAEILPAPAKTGGDAPTITVSNVTAQPGETVTVDVSLENNPGVISMMLRLAYDPALTLIAVEDTGVMPGREHDLTNFINPYILYWANETASSNITENGVIARLTFRLADDAAPGVYPITVSYDNGNYDIFDYDFVPVDFEVVNGGVMSVLLGDANGDGVIAFADVAALYGMIFSGGTLTPEQQYVCDVNGDGTVSFADVAALYNYVFTGETA